jgi:hypothetical protein
VAPRKKPAPATPAEAEALGAGLTARQRKRRAIPAPATVQAKADGTLPPLATPKHGGGKLLRGGVPGNRGGQEANRIMSARIHQEARRILMGEAFPRVERIFQDEKATHGEVTQAFAALMAGVKKPDAKLTHGGGVSHEMTVRFVAE